MVQISFPPGGAIVISLKEDQSLHLISRGARGSDECPEALRQERDREIGRAGNWTKE
jgi:hypothetical protein